MHDGSFSSQVREQHYYRIAQAAVNTVIRNLANQMPPKDLHDPWPMRRAWANKRFGGSCPGGFRLDLYARKARKFTFCINIVEKGIPEYDVLGGYDAMMTQRHILPILEQTVEEYSVTW